MCWLVVFVINISKCIPVSYGHNVHGMYTQHLLDRLFSVSKAVKKVGCPGWT